MLREVDALALLAELRFPPLKISFDAISRESRDTDYRGGDWLAQLRWEGREKAFLVEYKSSGTPREIEIAIAQLKYWESTPGATTLPMLMTPYLSPQTLDRLLANRISGIDFSGNGVVVVPGRWFIYRTGQLNKFPSSAPIKAIFSGTSSLVSRILLAERMFTTVSAVRDAVIDRGGRITLGTVSKVLQSLEDELLVERNGGIKLLSPESLLDRLATAYQPPKITKRLRVRSSLDETFFAKALQGNDDKAQFQVATSGQPLYSPMVTSEQRFVVYTTSIDRLLRRTDAKEDPRFGTVELCETSDQRIYFDCRHENGIVWTAPLQVYLELSQGSERDRKAAVQFRQTVLTGS